MKRLLKVFVSFVMLIVVLTPVQATEFYNVNVGYQGYEEGTWLDFAYGGALAGTEGKDALDSLEVHLVDAPYGAQIEYRVYTISGWTEWVSSFKSASTSGQDLLGIQIRLKDFPHANVYYQSYRKDLGWGTWVSNGATSGTLNASNPITGFRVQVDEIGVEYQSTVGGTLLQVRHNRETQGSGLIYTVKMGLISSDIEAKIEYRAYFNNSGWSSWVSNNTVLGTERAGSTINALEARLVGLDGYHVGIQAQVDGVWWDYAYDGATAGTIDKPMTAYRVEIVKDVPVVNAETDVVETIVDTTPEEEDVIEGFTILAYVNEDEYINASERASDTPLIIDVYNGEIESVSVLGYVEGVLTEVEATFISRGNYTFDSSEFSDGSLTVTAVNGANEETTDLLTLDTVAESLTTGGVLELLEYSPLDSIMVNGWAFPATGDLNGDGRVDVVVGSFDGTVATYYQQVGGSYTLASPNPLSGVLAPYYDPAVEARGRLSFPSLGDFDNDGDLDLVLGYGDVEENSGYYLYENTGSTSSPIFGSSPTNDDFLEIIRGEYSFVSSGDYDNDGDDDLFLGYGDDNILQTLTIAINDGFYGSVSFTLMDVIDETENGDDDDNVDDRFPFWQNLGDSVEDMEVNYELADLRDALIPYQGDFNADGVIDFAFNTFSEKILVYYGVLQNDGSIQYIYEPQNNYNESYDFISINTSNVFSSLPNLEAPFAAAGDLDADGDSDFIIGSFTEIYLLKDYEGISLLDGKDGFFDGTHIMDLSEFEGILLLEGEDGYEDGTLEVNLEEFSGIDPDAVETENVGIISYYKNNIGIAIQLDSDQIEEISDDGTVITFNTTDFNLSGRGAESGSTIKVYMDSVLAFTTLANANGEWSYTLRGPFSDMTTYTFTITQTDLSGNISSISGVYRIAVED